MLVSVLASGSKGNSTYIKTKNHKILVDLGTTIKYIETKLLENEVLLKDIDYVFLTHTHTDHTSALKNIIKKYKPTIVLSELMLEDLKELQNYPNIKILEDDLKIDELLIQNIKTSHDTTDSRGYIFTEEDASIALITDTGYLNQKYFNKLKNKNVYLIESNHNVEMLMHGKYPKWLKQRVNSDVGHLSNDSCSFYLTKLIGNKTKKIILLHLSEENNTPDLALETLSKELEDHNIKFNDITISSQNEKTELIEV